MQEDVLQDDLCSHGTEANTTSSLDPIRDAVSAKEGIAMALQAERRDCSVPSSQCCLAGSSPAVPAVCCG